jgi:hypothetical protein
VIQALFSCYGEMGSFIKIMEATVRVTVLSISLVQKRQHLRSGMFRCSMGGYDEEGDLNSKKIEAFIKNL